MKKFLALFLALSMIFALCACGGSQTAAPAAPAAPAENSGAAAAAPAESAEEIVLTFPCIWVGTDSKAPYLAEMIEAFNAENAGKIKVVVEEQTDYQAHRDKQRTLFTTGNVPDINCIDAFANVADYIEAGLFEDLTPYLEGEWGATFAEGALDMYAVDGVVGVLPVESAVFPLCYNKEILAECGYDAFPDNYTDLMEMFAAIKSKGYNAMGQMAGENAWTSMLWYSQLVLAIGGKEAFEAGLSDPAFVQAAEALKEMYKYTFDGAISAGAGDVNGHFIARDTAVYLNGPWWIANFYKEENGGLNEVIGVAANPKWEGGKGAGAAVAVCQGALAVGKQDDPARAEAAVKFLKYITDPAKVAEWSASSGAMFYVKYEPLDSVTPIAKEFASVQNNAAYTQMHVNNSFPAGFATEFPAAVSALVLDQVDAQGFVDMLQAAIDAG